VTSWTEAGGESTALQVTLASQSPQRLTLLARLGLDVLVQPSGVDETAIAAPADPAEQVRTLARAKAEVVASRKPQRFVLGADTLVAMDGLVLGKPSSPEAATLMLRQLSGRRHAVYTGIALIVPAPGTTIDTFPDMTDWIDRDAALRRVRQRLPNLQVDTGATYHVLTAVVSATVTFRQVDDDQVAAYVRTGEPLDKAGGYGIQGAGSRMVAALSGCFTTVVGLPVCAVALLMEAVSGQCLRCPADPECRLGDSRRCLCDDRPCAHSAPTVANDHDTGMDRRH
jgi:septum formation protein